MMAIMGGGMWAGHVTASHHDGVMPLFALIAATALLVWIGEKAQNQYARVARIITVVVIVVSIFMVVAQITGSFCSVGSSRMRGKTPMPNMMNFGPGQGRGQGFGGGQGFESGHGEGGHGHGHGMGQMQDR